MSVLADISNLRSVPIVVGDIYDPPLLGVDVLAATEVEITDAGGETHVKNFPAAADGGRYPYRWWIRIVHFEAGDTNALLGIRG